MTVKDACTQDLTATHCQYNQDVYKVGENLVRFKRKTIILITAVFNNLQRKAGQPKKVRKILAGVGQSLGS